MRSELLQTIYKIREGKINVISQSAVEHKEVEETGGVKLKKVHRSTGSHSGSKSREIGVWSFFLVQNSGFSNSQKLFGP
jgi:hypothetical protein